ncbi:MAG: hypothetical protein KDD24_04770 [Flavobacteriales bacterium]|jgi:phosphate/sulfate permease|nr:hypothetical protein [Flavobacteriales bacterium]MCB9175240.1 hypothetical protein [Flavobacteriales bacterium]
MEQIILLIGFCLASYSVIANDAIQTLGTFISSNIKRPWWVLWLFAGSILTATLLLGWYINNGDVAYGRLDEIPYPENINWWYVLPPLILLVVTQFGLPVSTTFLVLSVFSSTQVIEKMLLKSVIGYSVAFAFAIGVYFIIAKYTEIEKVDNKDKKLHWRWEALQWISTSWLWIQWLVQDFANIYVFLPRELSLNYLLLSLGFMLLVVGLVFKMGGGKIQKVVTQKTNTENIRSATIIDLVYAVVLFVFTVVNPIPMSTTWVFIGILAGREFAIMLRHDKKAVKIARKKVMFDLYKVNAGLIISILVAFVIRYFN